MKRATYEQYAKVVSELPHEWGHPIEGSAISAMQWIAPDDDLIAQAVYHRGTPPQYYLTEEVTDDTYTKSNAPA